MSFSKEDERGAIADAGLSSKDAGSLKLGSYAILEGHPCKVRMVNRSMQDKHGLSFLRVKAVGIFDERKREVDLYPDDEILIPSIKTLTDVLSVATRGGFAIVPLPSAKELPGFVTWKDTKNKPDHGKHALLTVTVACGHVKPTAFTCISDEETVKLLPPKLASYKKEMRKKDAITKGHALTMQDVQSTVLSKKNQRKMKKLEKLSKKKHKMQTQQLEESVENISLDG